MVVRVGHPLRQGALGFTLIELAITLSLLGILTTVALPPLIDFGTRAQWNGEDATIGSVQTGLYLYRMQAMVERQAQLYPPTLDSAISGEASPVNPIFTAVLMSPIMTAWVKESDNRYRGPTGRIFIYDPSTGSVTSTDESEVDPWARFGTIIGDTGYLVIFDSGTILLRDSPLSYVPDVENNTVNLTLHNGTSIATESDGSALISFPDGTEITVNDVMTRYNPIQSDFYVSSDGRIISGQSTGISHGYAYQSNYDVEYTTQNYSRDPQTGSYQYDYIYTMDGQYSGGALGAENGFLYDMTYSYQPSRSTGELNYATDGSYSGTYNSQYDYDVAYHYGMTSADAGSEQGFSHFYQIESSMDHEYSFNVNSNDFESTTRGRYGYASHEFDLHGQSRETDISYTYESSHRNNRQSGAYSGSYRYVYDNGNDYSYQYSYDPRTRRYNYSYTDNRTGDRRSYSY